MSLFRRDPRKDLERAEELLAEGRAVRALEIAEGIEKAGRPPFWKEAETLAARARGALFENALQASRQAEEDGDLEDAVDWLLAALERAPDEKRRAEVEERIKELEERAARPPEPDDGEEEGDDSEPWVDLDLDTHYLTLVDTLVDEVAEHYRDRPESFRRAFVDLNDGNLEAAVEALEALLEEHPEDPLYRLERGRGRLALGDPEGARDDFEAVWETIGEGPLDRAGQITLPGLWGEAVLALGDSPAVAERLAGLSDPAENDRHLTRFYLLALMMEEEWEEARQGLLGAMDLLSDPEEFHSLLARVLGHQGRREEAIDFLESTLTADRDRHGRPKLNLASLRTLIELYLQEGGQEGDEASEGRGGDSVERAGELLGFLTELVGENAGSLEHRLRSRYYAAIGDREASIEAAEVADELFDPQEAAIEDVQRGIKPRRPELSPPPG